MQLKARENTNEYRQVIVEPVSSWREAAWVLYLVAIIGFFVVLRVLFLPQQDSKLFMQPYYRIDSTLDATERSIYQAFLSSQKDILRSWQKTKKWPSVEFLYEEGMPPFAGDMMPGFLQGYSWQMYDRGPWVDYLGVNLQKGEESMPSALMRIINLHADFHPHPHPGKDYDPEQRAAVQIWMHPTGKQKYVGMQLIEFGWSWVVSAKDPILSLQKE